MDHTDLSYSNVGLQYLIIKNNTLPSKIKKTHINLFKWYLLVPNYIFWLEETSWTVGIRMSGITLIWVCHFRQRPMMFGGKKGNKKSISSRILIPLPDVFYTIYALIGRCGLVGSTITLLKTNKIIMTCIYINKN